MMLTPNEVRKILLRAAYGHGTLDGKDADFNNRITLSSGLIHRIYNMADHAGLSGEDKMTMLAYHALKQLDEVMSQYIEFQNLVPGRHIFMDAQPPTRKTEQPRKI